ncbi:MAG TPA: HAD family hydrolase [Thermomicrobiales bacterium]|nr:HAD family hydrolase [Thermomicrobiales bacterium]
MKPVTAILLDLDETILFDDAATDAAFAATAAHAARLASVDPERLISAVRARADDLWDAGPDPAWCHDLGTSSVEGLRSRFPGDDPRMAALRTWGPGFRRQSWQQGLQACGIEDDRLAEQLDERFAHERLHTNPFIPGAEQALRELASRFRLALVTNGLIDVQRDKVIMADIGDLFEAVVVSGELGYGKPTPAIYHHTLDLMGIAPEQAMMVGDNIRRDVGGAQAVGIKGVWIGDGVPPAELGITPDITIRTLAELPSLV